MPLEEILVQKLESLGPIIWQRAFGWISAHTSDKKFFAGYKIIDENYLHLLLLLSPESFQEAMKSDYFEKFEFGKTWAETEITSEEELDRVWLQVVSAYNFAKLRKQK